MNRVARVLRVGSCAFAVVLAGAGSLLAQTTSNIPDIGVDGSQDVTDFGSKAGTYLGAVLGLALAIYAIRLVIRWVRGLAK